jgi:hypothetical protein
MIQVSLVTIILLILFVFLLVQIVPLIREKYTYPPVVYPNYLPKFPGSVPSNGFMKDPAGAINQPYYEGEFDDVILPESMGVYTFNPDYYDYAGIYP